MVMILGTGTGSLKETVESLTVEDRRLPGAQGYNALHLAAIRGGRLDICRYLVEEIGVDVNSTDKEGDCDIVELLLAKGAYVDLLASNVTPLYLAAREGNDAAMKILLDHNADYNRMVNGKTPLMCAMDSASMKCMHLLIKAGADIMGAAMYAVDSPNVAELLSPDFFSCVLEDIGNHQYDLDADEPVAKRRTRIARFKSLGDNCFKTKDYVSAAGYYSLALYLVPDDDASATLFSNRSLCWLHMGDGGKALLDAEECQKKRPDWPKAHYRMGTALMFLKDYQRACERFSDALKLDPGSSEIEDALRKASESLKLSWSKQV
ncbi:hypothetical protein ACQ4PT_039675 [Festuca glaucescens]